LGNKMQLEQYENTVVKYSERGGNIFLSYFSSFRFIA